MTLLSKKIKQKLKHEFDTIRIRNHVKYFCIGANKTGTTSIKKAFKQFRFKVGNQRKAELLMSAYFKGDFEPIIRYCKTGEFFQDVPFSCPETYRYLDEAIPNSKFILTVRNSADEWYNSLVKFHSKLYGNGSIPSVEMLKQVDYVYKGWTWEVMTKTYGINEKDNPYDKEMLLTYYNNHVASVKNYFKSKPNDLLVLNVSEKGAYQKLANFVGIEVEENANFPWENKT